MEILYFIGVVIATIVMLRGGIVLNESFAFNRKLKGFLITTLGFIIAMIFVMLLK